MLVFPYMIISFIISIFWGEEFVEFINSCFGLELTGLLIYWLCLVVVLIIEFLGQTMDIANNILKELKKLNERR